MANASSAETNPGIREDLANARSELRGFGAAIGELADAMRELVSREGKLARAEVSDSVAAAKSVAMFGAVAALLGLFALGFLTLALMYGLDTVMPQWAAALITALIVGVFAAIAGLMAKRQLSEVSVVPRRTVSSVKEDLQWASEQIKQSGTSSNSGS